MRGTGAVIWRFPAVLGSTRLDGRQPFIHSKVARWLLMQCTDGVPFHLAMTVKFSAQRLQEESAVGYWRTFPGYSLRWYIVAVNIVSSTWPMVSAACVTVRQYFPSALVQSATTDHLHIARRKFTGSRCRAQKSLIMLRVAFVCYGANVTANTPWRCAHPVAATRVTKPYENSVL